jgi:hypothetical protein
MYPTSRQFTNVNIDGGGDAPAAPTPIKVSQATVDAVKNDGRGNLGVAAANKVAYGSPGYDGSTFSPNAPVSAEYKEATKRVYPNAKASSPASSSGATNPKQPGPKSQNPKSPGPSNLPPSKPAAPAKIKVSQETIDAIKKEGKKAALGYIKNGRPGYNGSTFDKNAPVSAEYKEGVRRLYQSPAKPKPKAPASKGGGGGGRNSAVN